MMLDFVLSCVGVDFVSHYPSQFFELVAIQVWLLFFVGFMYLYTMLGASQSILQVYTIKKISESIKYITLMERYSFRKILFSTYLVDIYWIIFLNVSQFDLQNVVNLYLQFLKHSEKR